MSMQILRLGAIEELKRGLNRGFLTHHSFDISVNGSDGTLVAVKFKDRPEYAFALLHPKTEVNQSPSWRSVESPGRHFTSAENYDHSQFNQAFNAVYSWADRVNEEVVLGAKVHEDTSLIDEMRRNVSQTADNLHEPDQPFTPEELEDWSAQLKRLVGRLSELERQNEIQSGRVEQLSRELEHLKKQGATLPKRTWLKTAGNKVLDLLDSTSKAALKALAEGAVKALLDHKS